MLPATSQASRWARTFEGLRGAGDAPRASSPQVPLRGHRGAVVMGTVWGDPWGAWWPSRGAGESKPCLHPACALPAPCSSPPPSLCKRAFCAAGFFSPLLIPNQEIKGRQRLRLFPLCRELESSGRGDRPFPDRPRGGGRAPGGGAGGGQGTDDTLGAAVGGPGGTAGAKAHWVLRGPAGVGWGLRAPAGGWEALRSRGGGGRLGMMGWPALPAAWRFPC